MCVQVSDTLKKFAVKVTTGSVKERQEIFGELKQCIKSKGALYLLLMCFCVVTEEKLTADSFGFRVAGAGNQGAVQALLSDPAPEQVRGSTAAHGRSSGH